MSVTGVDLRRSVRLAVKVRVTYETLDDFLSDYTANVSLGGMFIQTDRPLPIGSRFRLRFEIPERRCTVETTATVRWLSQSQDGLTDGMGVIFDALSDADERRVEKWLRALATATAGPQHGQR